MLLYSVVMVAVATVLVVVLLWIVTRHTTRFLVRRLKEAQAVEYEEFQHALRATESPMELEFFMLKYPNSIYCQHALFEIAEKYNKARRFHLAREGYQKFLATYSDSFHADIASARLQGIDDELADSTH